MVRIDRIGQRWVGTLQCIIALQSRGVKIRSPDETEGWTRFLDLESDDPMAFVRHQTVSMAAWVADQERKAACRRTKEGLARQRPGKDHGKASVPHRRPGADGEADERSRSVWAEDRAAPGGRRKDGAERHEGGTVNIHVMRLERTSGGADGRSMYDRW